LKSSRRKPPAARVLLPGLKPVIDFVRIATRSFKHTGTLFPSSAAACRTMVRHLPQRAATIVEYGAGNGILTSALLESLDEHSKLVAIEIVDEYVKLLRERAEARLHVQHDDVLAVSTRLREFAPGGVDAVVSGIPFSFLEPEQRDVLVANTKAGLKEGGRFLLYQNSPAMMRTLRRHFGNVRLHLEPRNIPPYFIMVATKR
jgi:phospholipid N-methyltransferase